MVSPLVSICIPTYNGAAFLQEALDSVMAQDHKNLEVVISDDASKDDTLQIVERFRESAPFPVHIHNHNPSGIGANWNHTLKKAKGTYIKFLFQDDVLMEDCVSKMVAHMETHPELGLVACKRKFLVQGTPSEDIEQWLQQYENLQHQFDTGERVLTVDKSLFARADFLKSPLNKIGEPPTVLFKKSIIDEVGFFDEDLKQILDYMFYYRILKKYPIAILNEPLVAFRVHPQQATNVNRNQDIPDYEIYDKLLYKDFLPLLHPWIQNRLKGKYDTWFRFKKRIRTKLYGRK